MGFFKSLFLWLKSNKVISSKHPGDVAKYADFALKNVSSLVVRGPICARDLARLACVSKSFHNLSRLDLSQATQQLEIPNNLFHGCSSLESVSLPCVLVRIGTSAFEGCLNLVSVIIPEGVEIIGRSAFYGCSSISCISIPASMKKIGSWSLTCSNLADIRVAPESKSFVVEDDVLFTADKSVLIKYPACKPQESYALPAEVREVADAAFINCSCLKHVSFNQGLLSIGDNAFQFSSIQEFVAPQGLQRIGKLAFSGSASLLSINICGSVCYIGDRAFTQCHKLSNGSVIVQEGVCGIGTDAFANCCNLTQIDLPSSAYVVNN